MKKTHKQRSKKTKSRLIKKSKKNMGGGFGGDNIPIIQKFPPPNIKSSSNTQQVFKEFTQKYGEYEKMREQHPPHIIPQKKPQVLTFGKSMRKSTRV